MTYFIVKAVLSGLLIAAVSTIASHRPVFGALVASLPLISVLGMVWLWRDTHDSARMQAHVGATFWYVLPSLPMFLLIPALMRAGVGFPWALLLGCVLTVLLYLLVSAIAPRLGIQL
ncbi:DUF3147 family protein [Lichenicola sp.]|uniref:DUF3147 family protein n=1 Tax=Lichenicola sp. TaxID=2804529 RepID=UPI003B003E6E